MIDTQDQLKRELDTLNHLMSTTNTTNTIHDVLARVARMSEIKAMLNTADTPNDDKDK